MADLVVAGSGMAGLAAAARARELGATPRLLEKGDRPGGNIPLASCVVWRYRDLDRFRAECPGGDPDLQGLVHGRLDDALAWLESLGAPVVERSTGNPLTTGVRFDPAGLAGALVAAAGEPELSTPLRELPDGPVVLATGGFHAGRELLRRHVTPEADHVLIRAHPWSTGDGMRLALAAGAAESAGLGEVYGRLMPAPPARIEQRDFVRLAQLYAGHATLRNRFGETFRTRTWSEIDAVQWAARQPGARAWLSVAPDALGRRVRERTVADMVEAARAAGAPVARDGDAVVVEVAAGVTTTLGGIRVDTRAQAAPDVYAAGADVGGIATGGYASGLAAALVLGRTAAESALS